MVSDFAYTGLSGLFDNLFDSEIIYLASLCLSPYESKLFFRGSAFSNRVSLNVVDRSSPLSLAATSPRLSSARRLTEAWVTGALPHPLAVEPPAPTPEYGIATPPTVRETALVSHFFAVCRSRLSGSGILSIVRP